MNTSNIDSDAPDGCGSSDPPPEGASGCASGRRARRFWRPDEDETLRRLVRSFGAKNWKHIAEHLPGRTPKQCRERWTNQANPAINHSDFTPEEDEAIIRLRLGKTGSAWAKIREQLPGYSPEHFRTDNQVKNRWYATLCRVVEVRDMRPWTPEEDAVLLRYGADADGNGPRDDEVRSGNNGATSPNNTPCLALPGRTKRMIRARAQVLGVRCSGGASAATSTPSCGTRNAGDAGSGDGRPSRKRNRTNVSSVHCGGASKRRPIQPIARASTSSPPLAQNWPAIPSPASMPLLSLELPFERTLHCPIPHRGTDESPAKVSQKSPPRSRCQRKFGVHSPNTELALEVFAAQPKVATPEQPCNEISGGSAGGKAGANGSLSCMARETPCGAHVATTTAETAQSTAGNEFDLFRVPGSPLGRLNTRGTPSRFAFSPPPMAACKPPQHQPRSQQPSPQMFGRFSPMKSSMPSPGPGQYAFPSPFIDNAIGHLDAAAATGMCKPLSSVSAASSPGAQRNFASGSPFTMSMLAMLRSEGSNSAEIPKLKPLDS